MEGVSEEQESKRPEGVDFAPGREERRGSAENNGAADNSEASSAGNEQTASAENAGDENDGGGAESELDRARREVAELKDHWNRERADFANFRKRTIVERQKAEGEAVARFTRELLNVLDNLDRVLSMKTDNPEVNNFLTGVQMIRENFIQVLGNHRIRTVTPEGQPFDPTSMEAIAKEDREDLERDTGPGSLPGRLRHRVSRRRNAGSAGSAGEGRRQGGQSRSTGRGSSGGCAVASERGRGIITEHHSERRIIRTKTRSGVRVSES